VEINPAAAEMAKTVYFCNIQPAERKAYIEKATDLIRRHLRFWLEPIFSWRQGQETGVLEDSFRNLIREATGEPFVYNIVINTLLRFHLSRKKGHPHAVLSAFEEHKSTVEELPYSDQPCKFFLADARKIPLNDNSVDLVITSPPYINVFNYHQNYRRVMELAGWDLLHIARSEIGSNRRNRSNRFLTVVEYAIDMHQVLCETHRLIRPGGRVIFIVGRESKVRGISFQNGRIIAALAVVGAGFSLNLKQERKYLNRFGEVIYEDLIHLTPIKANSYMYPDKHFAHEVARYFLQKVLPNGLDKKDVHGEILSAIENPPAHGAPILSLHHKHETSLRKA